MYGNSFGKTSALYAGGKHVWHEIVAHYPIGGTVKNIAAFQNGDVIPSGAMAVLNQVTHEVVVFKASPVYSSTAKYAVGDVVLQEGKFYVCKTAITTGETFTSSKWTETELYPGLVMNEVPVGAEIESATKNLTCSVVYAGEVYIDRLEVAVPAAFLSLLPMITPIHEA